MKRVALTADLQLQPQSRYSTLSASGVTTRLEDFMRCFAWIVQEATRAECDTLFVLGDLFDSRTVIDVSVIDKACRAFAEARTKLDIHVLVGNHDAYLRAPTINSTQMLRGLATIHEDVTTVGPFVVVPWVDDRDAYRRALKRADTLFTKLAVPRAYLLSHGMFGSAVPMAKGLPVEWLQNSPWAGVFLGDVHDPVVLQKNPVIRYVGSPLQIHFGDAGRSRGFVVLDTQTGKHDYIENTVSPRFHVIAEHDDLKAARKDDFLRVSPRIVAPSGLVNRLVHDAKQLSNWVTTDTAADDDRLVASRIVNANQMQADQLLRAYCAFSKIEHPNRLIAMGLKLLQEAREQ